MFIRSTTSSSPSGSRAPLYALGRGLFLLLLLAVTAVVVSARAKRAEAKQKLLDFGAGLLRLYGDEAGLETRLVLNGQRLLFASGKSDRGVTALLDDAEDRCAHGEGIFARERALRDGDDRRGYVACLATNGGYLYAEQKGKRTRWTSITTDGVIDLGAMFPAKGDAPGIDLAGVPRPSGSRRILSSYGEGHPYAMTMYARPGQAEAGAAEYRQALAAAGWTAVNEVAVEEGSASFAVARDFRWLSVTVVPDGQGGTTVVVLGDHGGGA